MLEFKAFFSSGYIVHYSSKMSDVCNFFVKQHGYSHTLPYYSDEFSTVVGKRRWSVGAYLRNWIFKEIVEFLMGWVSNTTPPATRNYHYTVHQLRKIVTYSISSFWNKYYLETSNEYNYLRIYSFKQEGLACFIYTLFQRL